MALSFFLLCLVWIQVANSQYYAVPARSYPSSGFFSPSPISSQAAIYGRSPRQTDLKTQKLNPATLNLKCSPETAKAYFLSTPTEKIKATALRSEPLTSLVANEKDMAKMPVPHPCPLCNNFANIPKSSKIPPPPPIGTAVLPGIIDSVPAIAISENITRYKNAILPEDKLFADMYEKNKVPKSLRFDQELLEGFLTGLGL